MMNSVRDMNHNVTLVIVALVVATTLTSVGFAIPQQALAYGHHHNNNSIKVNQDINQLNACSNSICVNDASNDADIHR